MRCESRGGDGAEIGAAMALGFGGAQDGLAVAWGQAASGLALLKGRAGGVRLGHDPKVGSRFFLNWRSK